LYFRFLSISIFLIFILLIIQCATRGRPAGGPVDKIPPEVIYTFPSSDSLGIDYLEEIQIGFSERMDENSVNKSIFISPALDYEIDWSGGDELSLQISPDSLHNNQTYVITIGSEASDSRRNRMNASFQFAFSTGKYLDQGKISGRIYNIKNNEVMNIYAYELTEKDTINPRNQVAQFLTQSGEKGKYRLNYLPLKKYRLFVVEDQNKNLLLDAAYERIGIPTRDVILDSTNLQTTDLNFKLTQIDTTAPFISSARAIYNNTILVRASEEVKKLSTENILITDTLNFDTLKILSVTGSKESQSQYLLYTTSQDSNAFYKMTVKNVSDTSLNNMIDPSTVYFQGISKQDTTSFALKTILPPDSTKNFSIFNNIMLEFTLPIDTNSLNSGFTFIQDSGNGMSGFWEFLEMKNGVYKTRGDLEPGKNFRFTLQTNLIKSIWGDTLADTVYNHIFSTVSDAEFGSISGRVKLDPEVYKYLFLFSVNIKNKQKVFDTKNTGNQTFRIDWLPEGYYIFKGFIDLDKNNKWSPGKLKPFQYAEPFFIKEDTVRVRKRWETSELEIYLENIK
jgi:hypothetical protein